MKNKKGDIAVTLFVIMIVVLCGIALASFSYIDSSSGNIDIVPKIKEFYNMADSNELLKDPRYGILSDNEGQTISKTIEEIKYAYSVRERIEITYTP